MSVNLANETKIDESIKKIVMGYLRNIRNTFSTNNIYNISPLVFNCCLLFYFITEYFVKPRLHGNSIFYDIQFNASHTIAKVRSNNNIINPTNVIDGNVIIDKSKKCFIYAWMIKVKRTSSTLMIGIADINKLTTRFDYSHYLYSKTGLKNYLDPHDPTSTLSARYGNSFTRNDFITIVFDVSKNRLKFSKNGKSQGIAFDDINFHYNQQYTLCIQMRGNRSCVKLIDFKQIYRHPYIIEEKEIEEKEIKEIKEKEIYRHKAERNRIKKSKKKKSKTKNKKRRK